MYALVHTGCGHFGGLATHAELVADQLRLLVAAGYNRWTCETIQPTDVPTVQSALLSGERTGCITCRVDPLRGLLPEALKVSAEMLPLTVHRR
ncbi:MAG: hypothetical protein JWP11_3708 [Frankiales bacterium]|nr:hypothetical protein [Frankiales bacterium]